MEQANLSDLNHLFGARRRRGGHPPSSRNRRPCSRGLSRLSQPPQLLSALHTRHGNFGRFHVFSATLKFRFIPSSEHDIYYSLLKSHQVSAIQVGGGDEFMYG